MIVKQILWVELRESWMIPEGERGGVEWSTDQAIFARSARLGLTRPSVILAASEHDTVRHVHVLPEILTQSVRHKD